MKLLVCVLAIFAISEANVQRYAPVAPISKSVVQAFNEQIEQRVLGGTIAATNEFPHMVAVLSSQSTSGENDGFCGGSLISTRHVITAAHCMKEYTVHHVILGTLQALNDQSVGYTKILVASKKIHEGFDRPKIDNDIVLLTLTTNAPSGNNIKPVLLPRNSFASTNLNGKSATLTGWGKVNDDSATYLSSNLLKVSVPIVDNEECRLDYGSTYINDKKMCVDTKGGTVGACYGDSGSPLTYFEPVYRETIQIGVMSFGAKSGCTDGFRTVYTRVSSFTSWIASNGGPAARP